MCTCRLRRPATPTRLFGDFGTFVPPGHLLLPEPNPKEEFTADELN